MLTELDALLRPRHVCDPALLASSSSFLAKYLARHHEVAVRGHSYSQVAELVCLHQLCIIAIISCGLLPLDRR